MAKVLRAQALWSRILWAKILVRAPRESVTKVSGLSLIVFSLLLVACDGGGNQRGYESVDGTGNVARFAEPHGVATDSAGNVYVADTMNSTIRKITPAGAVSTFAGTAGARGSTDGIGAAARFWSPMGVATDNAGNVYVADSGNNAIRKITPQGEVSTFAGTAGGGEGSSDGIGAAVRFNTPHGVATDSEGNVYVADSGNNTVRKITPDGAVTTLAGMAGFFSTDEGRRAVRQAELAGTWDALHSTDGIGAAARFNAPHGIATDSAGNVYVADSRNNTVRKITSDGAVTTLAGTAGGNPPFILNSVDGTGAAARFTEPTGVATDNMGNVYVADSGRANTIRKITPAGVVTTLAGTAGEFGNVNGTGAAARFGGMLGVATDSAGNVYVADWVNIRKITPAGVVTTLAGPAAYVSSVANSVLGIRFILAHIIPLADPFVGIVLTLIVTPIGPFVGHPERIAIVAGILFAGFLWLAAARRVRVQPLLLAAVVWALYMPWEWTAKDFGVRFDLFLISPALVAVTAWGLIVAFRRSRI